jgi:hypothetical protein
VSTVSSLPHKGHVLKSVYHVAFLECRIFMRENASGSYSTISYHIGWFLKLYFFAIVKGLLYTILCYFLAGMDSSFDRFIYFAALLSVLSNIGSSIAFLLITAIKDVDGAASAYTSWVGTMATFCGFFFLPNLTPALFKGTYYSSWYKYALEGLYWNEFEGTNMTFLYNPVSNQTMVASDVYIKRVFNSTIGKLGPNSNCTACVFLEKPILTHLDIDQSLNRYTNLIVLMMYPILFHILSYIASALHVGARKRHSKLRNFLGFFRRSKNRRKIGDVSVFSESDQPPVDNNNNIMKAKAKS